MLDFIARHSPDLEREMHRLLDEQMVANRLKAAVDYYFSIRAG